MQELSNKATFTIKNTFSLNESEGKLLKAISKSVLDKTAKGEQYPLTIKLEEIKNNFLLELQDNEKAKATLTAYRKDITQYLNTLDGKEPSLEATLKYKEHLTATATTSTTNRKLIAINKFLVYAGYDKAKVKLLKVQKASSLDNVISRADYERLLRWSEKLNKPVYWHIIKTLAGTGIRIGELQYITIEAVKAGVAEVNNKGKIRTIPIAKSLKKLLMDYAKAKGITKGSIFITSKGNPISEPQVFRALKQIAGQARVNKAKVHPHAFRHLFAISFLEAGYNITELADILGHNSLETTRIYTRTTTKDKANKMDTLKL